MMKVRVYKALDVKLAENTNLEDEDRLYVRYKDYKAVVEAYERFKRFKTESKS